MLNEIRDMVEGKKIKRPKIGRMMVSWPSTSFHL
jgi:hypothetical protein